MMTHFAAVYHYHLQFPIILQSNSEDPGGWNEAGLAIAKDAFPMTLFNNFLNSLSYRLRSSQAVHT